MFIKKNILKFFKCSNYALLLLVLTIRSDQSSAEIATTVGQMVTGLNEAINETLASYNDHLSQASALLDIVRLDLEKIVFQDASGNENTNGGVATLSPEQSAALNTLVEEDNYPQWVKRAILSSPTVKIKKDNVRIDQNLYTAADIYDLCTIFLLQEGDHTLWITGKILYGYDKQGCYFTQKNCGERSCIKNT